MTAVKPLTRRQLACLAFDYHLKKGDKPPLAAFLAEHELTMADYIRLLSVFKQAA